MDDKTRVSRSSVSSALQYGQWYKKLSRAREKKKVYSDDGEDSVTKDGEGKKKAAFEV